MAIRRMVSVCVLLLAFSATPAVAQEVSLSCYLVPKVEGTMTSFRPKYINSQEMPGTRWAAMDLGIEPLFLICALLTPEQEAFVSSQPDVFVIPPLDTQVGGNPVLNQTKNSLEQRNIPAEQVTATSTWRQVVAIIGKNCLILQRLSGLHHTRLFPPGVSLDSVPDATTLQQLIEVGQSFGFDTSAITGTMQIRQILNILTAQMAPFVLLNEVF